MHLAVRLQMSVARSRLPVTVSGTGTESVSGFRFPATVSSSVTGTVTVSGTVSVTIGTASACLLRMGEYELAACPACASQASCLVADREQLKQELEELWRFHLRRRRESVPARQLYDRAFFTLDPPLQLVQCKECGTLYRNP